MDSLQTTPWFVRREMEADEEGLTPTMLGLLVVVICLFIVGSLCVVALLVLRRIRTRREAAMSLPTHNQSQSSLSAPGARRGHRRTLTITSTPYAPPQVTYTDSEKNDWNEKRSSSPVPEIHITFPEDGEKRSSRVVVVKITDNGGVGLEPYQEKQEEQLPQYERTQGEFRSLDLERMGGLKEKTNGDEKRWG